MPLALSLSFLTPSLNISENKQCCVPLQRSPLPTLCCYMGKSKFLNRSKTSILRSKPDNEKRFIARDSMDSGHQIINDFSLDWGDNELDDDGDIGSPWEGAIIYKRDASVSHVEYCTTLERLGLAKLSTDISKSRASEMGLRVTKAVKDYPLGTPVQISMDVTSKKQRLRLDGIIKTVISLHCNRCGEPAAEAVYSNFSLLLTEEPSEEPDSVDMGVVFEDDKFGAARSSFQIEGDKDDDIDWEDRLHFPPEDDKIDISKPIRDMVHLEVTINAICDPSCKGLCLHCGMNFNKGTCNCSERKVKEKDYGPLKHLRKQMLSKS